MLIPPAYQGREQSFLKHRLLREYLGRWGRKLGSLSRRGRVRLWYVDCFAGPWKSQSDQLADTSIDIGLRALEEAAVKWREQGHAVDLHAVFVEKKRKPFEQLEAYLRERGGSVTSTPIFGAFGDHVDEIAKMLADDPAFIFVDPTGFKGVAMSFIQPLVQRRVRDVLINVMFNDINRFKDDERTFLREQIRDFFGLGDSDLERGLSEEELLRTYRMNLKRSCGLDFAADLAIPHPTIQRTWFRLVIGGKHRDVLSVFRDAERLVVGGDAAEVRDQARKKAEEQRTGQLSLGVSSAPAIDGRYETMHERDRNNVIRALVEALPKAGGKPFGDLWPPLLEEYHVTKAELGRIVVTAHREGRVAIDPPPSARRQRAYDEDLIRKAAQDRS